MNDISSHLEHISVSLRALGYPLAILFIAAAAVGAVWYYRTTLPPVSGFMRKFLSFLRFAALFLIIAGLTEPVIHTVMSLTLREKTAVLIDTSSSIDLPVDTTRKSDVLSALKQIEDRLGDTAEYYAFDRDIRPLDSGDIVFGGHGTDISRAVAASGAKDNISSILLVSDGRWNLGEDPASADFKAGVPVYSVMAGSDKRIPEFSIGAVSAPPVAYQNKPLSLETSVNSALPVNGSIRVDIVDNGRVVTSGNASFGGGTQAKVRFEVTPDHPGKTLYTAVIDPQEDSIADNNTQSIAVQVLKSSFNVLIAAPGPSADLAFIRRALETDPAFSIEVIVDTGITAVTPPAEENKPLDAVIVIDGGGRALTSQSAESLVRRVNEGCGLWTVGSAFNGDGASVIAGALPVSFPPGISPVSGDFAVKPTGAGATHFITTGVYDSDSRDTWDFLPPLQSILAGGTVKADGLVIAEVTGRNAATPPLPAIITGRLGRGKVIAMPVSGIWRWSLMSAGAGRDYAFFTSFVVGTLRWLTSDTDTTPLTITAGTGTYLSGQDILFEGRLFDKIYMPVTGANISVVVDNDPGMKVFLAETEPTVYRGSLRGMETGNHTFTASAYVGETLFAESTGTFAVERSSLETIDTTASPDVLGALAVRTGGLSVTAAGIDSIFKTLHNDTTVRRVEHDRQLAANPLLPVAIVIFLVVEWSIRRRKGML